MRRIPLPPTIGALFLAAALAALPAAAQDKTDGAEPRLKLIFVERFRFEAWDNAVSLDETAADASAYTRNRTTLGLDWKPLKNFEVLGKVTNEFRVYLAPKDRAFSWHELFVDNLYVKWTAPGRVPLTVTAGRQDLNFGEGFVIADGTPGDGSRSYYFNALRVDAGLAEGHTLTAFAHATKATDRYLPVVHPKPQALAEQPESALALYYAGTFGKTKLDAYAVRKTTDANEAWPIATRTETFGARAVAPLAKPLSLTVEAALQTGRPARPAARPPGPSPTSITTSRGPCPGSSRPSSARSFSAATIRLTARMEGWDPIFSRWPKWSESYIYTYTRESRPSYWSNLSSVYAQLAFDLGARSDGHLMIMPMGAGQAQVGDFPGGTGRYRGTLLRGRLNYKVSKYLTGRFIWEHFTPGSFYLPGASSYNWLQFEMIFRY